MSAAVKKRRTREGHAETNVLPEYCYHLAEQDNLKAIEARGLVPARVLVEESGLGADEQRALLQGRRATRTTLPSGAVLRDNKPLPEAALERCLVGVTPGEWYRLLNEHFFLWLDVDRLDRQRKAAAPLPQYVLKFRTAELVAALSPGSGVFVTPINSGNAMRAAARRCRETFVPLADWTQTAWQTESAVTGAPRSRQHRPVELAVAGCLPDPMKIACAVLLVQPGEPLPAAILEQT